jgi:hypothetical protein
MAGFARRDKNNDESHPHYHRFPYAIEVYEETGTGATKQ